MEAIDYTIVGIYIGGVLSLLIGYTLYLYYLSYRSSSSSSSSSSDRSITNNEAQEFYLAKESSSWWIVAASYYASNIGTDAMVGLASAGATIGIVSSWYDLFSPLAFLLLAYVFLPIYRQNNLYTLPEYTLYRYGPYIRTYLSIVSLILYATNKIASALLCGILILSYTTSISFYISLCSLLFVTAIFSTLGGLRAVMYVEVLNTVLLFLGGTLSVLYTLHYLRIDSYDQLVQALRRISLSPTIEPTIDPIRDQAYRAGLDSSFTHLSTGTGPYALNGLLMGSFWLIGWFHLTDQEMVQRGLSASSNAHAKLGTIIGGILKLTVPWMWCLPGLLARYALYDKLGCSKDTNSTTTVCKDPNYAYPALIMYILPAGLRGIMVAGSIAGVISVLASTFNSAATMVSMDLWKPWITKRIRHIDNPSTDTGREEPRDRDGTEATDSDEHPVPNPTVSHTSPFSNASSSTIHIQQHIHTRLSNTASSFPPSPSLCSSSVFPTAPPSSSHRTITVTRIITTYFNRSTLFTYLASPHMLVWIGRIFILLLTGISIAWLPLIAKLSSSIYIAMQSLNAYVAPPILSLFLLAIFVPSVHEYGGLIGLGFGHLLGFIRLILLLLFEPMEPSSSSVPPIEPRNHALVLPFSLFIDAGFLQFAAFEGIVSMVLTLVASAAIKRPPRGPNVTDEGYEQLPPPMEKLVSPLVVWVYRKGHEWFRRIRGIVYGREGEDEEILSVTGTTESCDAVDDDTDTMARSTRETRDRKVSSFSVKNDNVSIPPSVPESYPSFVTNDPLPPFPSQASLIRLRVHSSFETVENENDTDDNDNGENRTSSSLLPPIRTRITSIDTETNEPPLYTAISTPLYENNRSRGTVTDIYIQRTEPFHRQNSSESTLNTDPSRGTVVADTVLSLPWYRTDDCLDTMADVCAIVLLIGVSVSMWVLW